MAPSRALLVVALWTCCLVAVPAVKIAVPLGKTECIQSEALTDEHLMVRNSSACWSARLYLRPNPKRPNPLCRWTCPGRPPALAPQCALPMKPFFNGAPPHAPPPQVPGGPRLDGRVLISSTRSFYHPFVSIRVRAKG